MWLRPAERFHVNIKFIIVLLHTFVSLAGRLFWEGGFTYLLSEKLTQDLLQEYFSKQYQKLDCKDNPSLLFYTIMLHHALSCEKVDFVPHNILFTIVGYRFRNYWISNFVFLFFQKNSVLTTIIVTNIVHSIS